MFSLVPVKENTFFSYFLICLILFLSCLRGPSPSTPHQRIETGHHILVKGAQKRLADVKLSFFFFCLKVYSLLCWLFHSVSMWLEQSSVLSSCGVVPVARDVFPIWFQNGDQIWFRPPPPKVLNHFLCFGNVNVAAAQIHKVLNRFPISLLTSWIQQLNHQKIS